LSLQYREIGNASGDKMLSAIFPIYRENFIPMDTQSNLSFARLFLDKEYFVPETIVGLSWKKYPRLVKAVEIYNIPEATIHVERIFAYIEKDLIPFVSRYRYPHTTYQYIHPQNISTIYELLHGCRTNIIGAPLYLLNQLSSCHVEPGKYSNVPENATTILEAIQYEDLTIHSMVPDSYSLVETWRDLCSTYDFVNGATYNKLSDSKYLLPKIPNTDKLLLHLYNGIDVSKYLSFGFNVRAFDMSHIQLNTQSSIHISNFPRTHICMLTRISMTDVDITICVKDKSYTIHYVVDRLSRMDETAYKNDLDTLQEFSKHLATCVPHTTTHIRIVKSFHEEALIYFIKDKEVVDTLYLDFCGLSLSSHNLVKY
jgi:hypothetical protein